MNHLGKTIRRPSGRMILAATGLALAATSAIAEHVVPAWAQTSAGAVSSGPADIEFTTQSLSRAATNKSFGMKDDTPWLGPVIIPPGHLSATDPYVYPEPSNNKK